MLRRLYWWIRGHWNGQLDSVGIFADGEATRAAAAHQVHLELIARVGSAGWKKIGAHEHPRLESERD